MLRLCGAPTTGNDPEGELVASRGIPDFPLVNRGNIKA